MEIESLLENAIKYPGLRSQFYKELLEKEVFVICRPNDDPRSVPQQLQFMAYMKQDNTVVIPFFTNLQVLQMVITEPVPYIKIPCREFFKSIGDIGCVINPYSNIAKEFNPQEIKSLLDGSIFEATKEVITKDTEVLIGAHEVYPQKLVSSLKDFFACNKNVVSAYIIQFFNPCVEKSPHSMVIIEYNGDYEKFVGEVGLVASSSCEENDFVTFMELDRNSEFCKSIIEKFQPFYNKKKKFGFF